MQTPTDASRRTSAAERLDEVMEIACRLAGQDAIGGIHVAISERPTYDELIYYRSMAEEYGLSLTLKVDTIVLRPLPAPEPDLSEHVPAFSLGTWLPDARMAVSSAWHNAGAHRIVAAPIQHSAAVAHWFRAHAANWNAGFQGLHEGTR